MKSGWFQIAIFLIACSGGPVWAWQGKVTRIVDGDSLWVRPAEGGAPVELRMDGIDAPEICQSGGQAARKALAARLMGREPGYAAIYAGLNAGLAVASLASSLSACSPSRRVSIVSMITAAVF